MKRRAFSLLEILISISVAGILLIVLFSRMKEFVFLRKEIASVETECLERQTIQIRLEELFSSLTPSEKEGDYRAPIFYQKPQLCFQVTKELDVDPAFNSELFYTLSYDPQLKTLSLQGKTSTGAERKEILAKGVTHCSFRFYSEKEKSWKESWPQNSRELPMFISMTVEKKSREIEYLIPIETP